MVTRGDSTYEATASEPNVVVQGGTTLVGNGIFAPQQTRIDIGRVGRVTLEVYLNAVYQGQSSYDT